MDKTRAKIKSTSMTAFVAILAIALLFGIQTSINIFDWLTTGEALSNPDSVRHGMGLLGDGLLVALAVYVALVFLRINREETPFFAKPAAQDQSGGRAPFRDARGAEVAVLGSRQHPNRNAVRRSRGRIGHVRLHAGRHRVLPRADHRVRLSRPRRELRDHLGGQHGYRAAPRSDDGRSQGFPGRAGREGGHRDGNLSKLKNGKVSGVRFKTLNAICKEAGLQPGDILEFVDDEEG